VGAISFAIVVVLLILSNIYSYLAKIISRFTSRNKERLVEQARRTLELGLIELSEGRFESAEKLFLKNKGQNENALLCYLSAAHAAQKQGAHNRRDDHLRKAHKASPSADIAISLTQAELQYSHKQFEQALATLQKLHELSPKHTYVLYLLAKTYNKLSDWKKLRKLMPELIKHKVFTTETLLPLEISTWKGLYSNCSEYRALAQLTELWDDTPKHLKVMPEILEFYARKLISIGAEGKAEQLLANHLNNSWDESVIVLYSELNVLADENQLENAESWLLKHPHNPYVLLSLSKMCLLRSLWGKARNYLEASISIKPLPQTYLLLANLLEEHMNDEETAQKYYRDGLLLLSEDCFNLETMASAPKVYAEEKQPALKVI